MNRYYIFPAPIKASAAEDFFASFFGLSKKEENFKALHSTLFSMHKKTGWEAVVGTKNHIVESLYR